MTLPIRIGIDIGHTNYVVGRLNPDGTPYTELIQGVSLIPAAVYLDSDQIVVGESADACWDRQNGSSGAVVHKLWKGWMGESHRVRWGNSSHLSHVEENQRVTPEALTAIAVEHIIQHLQQGATPPDIETVVVTVPHGWRRSEGFRCVATRDAAARVRTHNGQPLNVRTDVVSEPVAAAVYYLYQLQRADAANPARQLVESLIGRTALMVDVGGGTSDFSIVRIAARDEPVEVVDATHVDRAGIYADALICAEVARRFNAQHGTTFPEAPDGILTEVQKLSCPPELRRWMGSCSTIKTKGSQLLNRNLMRVQQEQPFDSQGRILSLPYPQGLPELLAPFHEILRNTLIAFLRHQTEPPAVVFFAGGGSMIYGIQNQVTRAALESVYGAETASQIMATSQDTAANQGDFPRAIALGAALIANDRVRVRERLLCDVGVVLPIGGQGDSDEDAAFAAPLAKHGLHPGENALITPILRHGDELPVRKVLDDFPIVYSPKTGKHTLPVTVVTQDADGDETTLTFTIPYIVRAHQRNQDIQMRLSAEGDGFITVELTLADGTVISDKQQMESRVPGTGNLYVASRRAGEAIHESRRVAYKRLTPAEVRSVVATVESTEGNPGNLASSTGASGGPRSKRPPTSGKGENKG